MFTDPAILALEDGLVLRGISFGYSGTALGELVFNTAMAGYQEILTDPSYARQIVTLTCPHIGNTGINPEDMESDKTWLEGLVIRNLPLRYSNYRARRSLADFLTASQVVAIAEVDTRMLTAHLRDQGARNAVLIAGEEASHLRDEDCVKMAEACPSLIGADLARGVSTQSTRKWSIGNWQPEHGFKQMDNTGPRVVVYDFGTKHNILRMLAARGCRVQTVPATTAAREVLAMNPDGILLSNGPGDPEACDYAIKAVGELLHANIPLLGICLGHQILALASGAQTVKMPHGHHGANHPVQDLASGRVMVTSQNHGFAVTADSLPENLSITHVSLFDGTVQGIAHKTRPALGFQGHPEASPGPQDAESIFDRFIGMMKQPLT